MAMTDIRMLPGHEPIIDGDIVYFERKAPIVSLIDYQRNLTPTQVEGILAAC